MQIDVSDLYDAFFEIARILWLRAEFKGCPSGVVDALGPNYETMMDELELKMFFAACSRRLTRRSGGARIAPPEIRRHLTLHDVSGQLLPGEQGTYQCQAFDWGTPSDADIVNRVAAGDLTPRSRIDTKIFLTVDGA
jgi:hypothetical protein